MYPTLKFKDRVTVYTVTPDDYGKDVPGEGEVMLGLYVQNTTFLHTNNQDGVSGTSRLYLPANTNFMKDNHYRLEGMLVKVNPFGEDAAYQYFRIIDVIPARDILNRNRVRHVECELQKVTDFGNED